MGRRRPARGDAGGGEDVPAARTGRAALIAGGAAAATAAGLTAWLARDAESGATARGVAALGGLAALVLVLGLLLRLPDAIGASAALLGGSYALVLLVDGGRLDRGAPLVGALLLLTCELGYWSHELRTTSPDEPGARARHVAWLCLLVLGTLVAGVALEVTAELARIDGIVVDAAGAGAAVAAFAVLAYAAASAGVGPRRPRGPHVEAERAEEAPWRGA